MLVRTHIFPCTMYTLFDHRARSHTRCKSTTAITPCYTSFLWSNWSFFQNHYSSRVQGFFSLHNKRSEQRTALYRWHIKQHSISWIVTRYRHSRWSCGKKKWKNLFLFIQEKKKKKTIRKRIQIYGLPKDKSWYTINTYLDASLSCLVFLLNDLGLGRWFPK